MGTQGLTKCDTDALTTFLLLLWSIVEQTHVQIHVESFLNGKVIHKFDLQQIIGKN